MSASLSSKEMLFQPVVGNHYVQLYENAEQLTKAVGHFVTNDLSDSQAIVIIATELHIQAFYTYLSQHYFDIDHLLNTGRLKFFDANKLLIKFVENEVPNGTLFFTTLHSIFKELFRSFQNVRIYGEMVDILWQNGQKVAAIQLEEYWNLLLKNYDFSLLCAYRIDNLEHEN